ncbi:probable F-box protein At4g22030 [Lathyrus oleraceus]|uniref:probable F-box protein At4g22030 n=1 Tax=Pisum sativum TaxID=3888 RepID=UPI0021D29F24|nr:probable F-box protein At4g22030 [Pisum sativum]
MLSLQSSLLLNRSPSSPCLSFNRIKCGIDFPKLPRISLFSVQKESKRSILIKENNIGNTNEDDENLYNSKNSNIATIKLYAILEAVCDRIEMHNNIGQQRDNWNILLLNSINMITLTASTMSAIACCSGSDDKPLLALKLSSSLLFTVATGMLLVMNKIQPSQLAEEQRNATRLFKQLHLQIQTKISLGNNNHIEGDVRDAIEKVLAIDKAYPLPLLGGKMVEKFPSKFEASCWWPCHRKIPRVNNNKIESNNGWNLELENELKEIIEVIKRKDIEDYDRLGNIALKINKSLAILGPLLTGTAAIGCFFVDFIPVFGGGLATVVNSFEHGGQVGMVFEMYRNCGGYFELLEEMVEETIEERDLNERENGEVFEMKMALSLGRSVIEMRELASKSASCRVEEREIDEFANKLF